MYTLTIINIIDLFFMINSNNISITNELQKLYIGYAPSLLDPTNFQKEKNRTSLRLNRLRKSLRKHIKNKTRSNEDLVHLKGYVESLDYHLKKLEYFEEAYNTIREAILDNSVFESILSHLNISKKEEEIRDQQKMPIRNDNTEQGFIITDNTPEEEYKTTLERARCFASVTAPFYNLNTSGRIEKADNEKNNSQKAAPTRLENNNLDLEFTRVSFSDHTSVMLYEDLNNRQETSELDENENSITKEASQSSSNSRIFHYLGKETIKEEDFHNTQVTSDFCSKSQRSTLKINRKEHTTHSKRVKSITASHS